ncbi:MAG: hypothetical protein Cons2KO_30560 [Congregibacter sp.]
MRKPQAIKAQMARTAHTGVFAAIALEAALDDRLVAVLDDMNANVEDIPATE